jgi:hypothetical protein
LKALVDLLWNLAHVEFSLSLRPPLRHKDSQQNYN